MTVIVSIVLFYIMCSLIFLYPSNRNIWPKIKNRIPYSQNKFVFVWGFWYMWYVIFTSLLMLAIRPIAVSIVRNQIIDLESYDDAVELTWMTIPQIFKTITYETINHFINKNTNKKYL